MITLRTGLRLAGLGILVAVVAPPSLAQTVEQVPVPALAAALDALGEAIPAGPLAIVTDRSRVFQQGMARGLGVERASVVRRADLEYFAADRGYAIGQRADFIRCSEGRSGCVMADHAATVSFVPLLVEERAISLQVAVSVGYAVDEAKIATDFFDIRLERAGDVWAVASVAHVGSVN